MDFSTEKIAGALREELHPLDEEANRLRQRLAELDAQRDRLNAALLALSGESQTKKRKRSGKPAATKAEVIDVIAGLLRDNTTLAPDDLKDLTKDKVANDLGKGLNGFALRFREALADPMFVQGPDGLIRLA
ncbi:MAG: hypothetical protein AAF532_07670 [Planctomycetota bacterium]